MDLVKSAFKFQIKTMGCKANIYDSLILEKELLDIGGERSEENPDLFILNSCTVTESADRQCLREVNQIKKKSPKVWSIVTGCFAEVGKSKLKQNSNIEHIVGNKEKNSLKSIVAKRYGIEIGEALDQEIYWGQLPTQKGKTRAFLKIQEGCNDFCTYCIIPFARGKSRSARVELILEEISRLSSIGIQEVILTGTNIADYGKDLESSLEDLVEAILLHTPIARLRLSSLDPSEVSDRLLNLISPTSRLMPHFHISLQSPISHVLRKMKRNYKTDDVRNCLNKIYKKSSDIFVGMDVIAGFPSETNEDQINAIKFLQDLPWSRLHVFPYSERSGTPAIKISGSVEVSERSRRAQELMSLSNNRHEKFVKKYIDTIVTDILVEGYHEAGGDFFVIGHSRNYLRVMIRVPSRKKEDAVFLNNHLVSSQILSASPKPTQDWTLEGKLLNSV